MVTDMYIPAFGLTPNSSYIPDQYLNAKGFVKVHDDLQVRGAPDVYALGDVCDIETPQYMHTDAQSKYLGKALCEVIRGRTPGAYKLATKGISRHQVSQEGFLMLTYALHGSVSLSDQKQAQVIMATGRCRSGYSSLLDGRCLWSGFLAPWTEAVLEQLPISTDHTDLVDLIQESISAMNEQVLTVFTQENM
jgi:NADH dehydrogenase FAD-containing subunit